MKFSAKLEEQKGFFVVDIDSSQVQKPLVLSPLPFDDTVKLQTTKPKLKLPNDVVQLVDAKKHYLHQNQNCTCEITEMEKANREKLEAVEVGSEESWTGKGIAISKRKPLPTSYARIFARALKELLKGASRGTIIGLTLKAGLDSLFALSKGKITNFKTLMAVALSNDVRRFAQFLALFIGLYRGVYTLLSCLRGQESKTNASIAGMVASTALLLDEKQRRKNIALYLFVRAADIFIRQQVRLKNFPAVKYAENIMFGLANVPIVYGFVYEPELVDRGYYNWIIPMGGLTHKGLDITVRERRNHFAATGNLLPFQPCQPHYHEGPCGLSCLLGSFSAFARAGKMYLPVHFLPMILFRYKYLFKNPVETIARTGKAWTLSSLFLTSYIAFVRLTFCFFRNALQQDHDFTAVLAGLSTGVATGFEKPSRVAELMMYCWRYGIEAMWKYTVKYGYAKSIPKGEVLLFTAAMGIIMSAEKQDCKPMYHKGITFLVGR